MAWDGPEAWRAIPGFPGYEASDRGRIRSFRYPSRGPGRKGWTVRKDLPGKLLAQVELRGGYAQVKLRRNGAQISMTVSRAVCLAFHGEPPNGDADASHLDGDPGNNEPDNLVWESHRENLRRRRAHGWRPYRDPSGRFAPPEPDDDDIPF